MFQNPLPDYLPIPTSQHDPRILSPPPSHQEHPGAPPHVPLSPCLQQRLCFIYQKNTTTWNQAARDRRWGAKMENFQTVFQLCTRFSLFVESSGKTLAEFASTLLAKVWFSSPQKRVILQNKLRQRDAGRVYQLTQPITNYLFSGPYPATIGTTSFAQSLAVKLSVSIEFMLKKIGMHVAKHKTDRGAVA